MTDTVRTYRGKPITDLTKDELVDAMTWAFQEIEYQRERADGYLQVAVCRPKPPYLREQALADLAGIPIDPENGTLVSALDNIRRALEALPE